MPTIYKSNWVEKLLDGLLGDDEDKEPQWEQLLLPLEHTLCEHQWYDDGDNFQIVCSLCGETHDVSFIDEWDGKTYQEIFELLQNQFHLVK